MGAAPWVVSQTRRATRIKKKKRRSRVLYLVLGGVLLLVVAAGFIVLDAYYQAYQVASRLEPITGDLNKARLALSRGKLPEGEPMTDAVDLASEARDGLSSARWTLGWSTESRS